MACCSSIGSTNIIQKSTGYIVDFLVFIRCVTLFRLLFLRCKAMLSFAALAAAFSFLKNRAIKNCAAALPGLHPVFDCCCSDCE